MNLDRWIHENTKRVQQDENDPFSSVLLKDLVSQNKELSRTLSGIRSVLGKRSTEELLSKKDYAALKSSELALFNLLKKRKSAAIKKERALARRERRTKSGAKWIENVLGKIDTDLKVKIVLASSATATIYDKWDLENEYTSKLEYWGGRMESKEQAIEFVEHFRERTEDTQHPDYPDFIKKYAETVKKLAK